MKVLVVANERPGQRELIAKLRDEFPQVDLVLADSTADQLREARTTDAIYGGVPARDVIVAAGGLRWVQVPGTSIDQAHSVPEIVDRGVIITNVPKVHAAPTADHVFALILGLSHKIPEAVDDRRARRYVPEKYRGAMVELAGTTVGVLGLGAIGIAVAQRATAFGMDVYGVSKKPKCPIPYVRESWTIERLDDLMRLSDWLVVAAPLTPETRGLIDRRRIGLLKKRAHLVVISRGGIVEEEAVVDALRAGDIAGAAFDVTAEQPLPDDCPLWHLPNVILTPHCAAASSQVYERKRKVFRENLRRFVKGEPLLYVCDVTRGY